MNKTTDHIEIDVEKTLALMPAWVKEKARRYREQKKLAEKVFGPVVRQIEKLQQSK